MSVYDTMVAGLSGASLVLLAVVTVTGSSDFHLNPGEMEDRLAERAHAALAEAGLSWAQVDMQGQTAIVRGTAPTQADAAQAERVVFQSSGRGGPVFGGVVGVRSHVTIGGPQAGTQRERGLQLARIPGRAANQGTGRHVQQWSE